MGETISKIGESILEARQLSLLILTYDAQENRKNKIIRNKTNGIVINDNNNYKLSNDHIDEIALFIARVRYMLSILLTLDVENYADLPSKIKLLEKNENEEDEEKDEEENEDEHEENYYYYDILSKKKKLKKRKILKKISLMIWL